MAHLFRKSDFVTYGRMRWETSSGSIQWLSPKRQTSRPGPLILSAHLDTVFPSGTDVTPRTKAIGSHAGNLRRWPGAGRPSGPGQIQATSPLPLPHPLLFVATVGEEGPGDLRGVRHLLAGAGKIPRPAGFISLDGVGLDRIIHRGVGSTRLRITLRGPGGHSWTDFGRPNPIHSLAKVAERPVP